MDCVSWADARSYCHFQGKGLCLEAQWERAARGGCELYDECPLASRKYPWGNGEPNCGLAVFADVALGVGCGLAGPATVGSRPFGQSPYGVMDMSGNLAEWVYDWYAADAYELQQGSNPKGVSSGALRVVRGGDYASVAGGAGANDLRVSARASLPPDADMGPVGIRCCTLVAP